MQTLRDLLEQAMTYRDVRSGRALAELAAKHGKKIDRTQVNAIMNGTYKSRPQRPLLEAVAWLANVDIEDAYAAAQLPLPGPSFADELPPDVDYLGPRERQAIITVIRAFLGAASEETEVMGNAEHPAPIELAPEEAPRLKAARKTGRLTARERQDEAAKAAMRAKMAHRQAGGDEKPLTDEDTA